MDEEKEKKLLMSLPKKAIILLYFNERSSFNSLCKVIGAFNPEQKKEDEGNG